MLDEIGETCQNNTNPTEIAGKRQKRQKQQQSTTINLLKQMQELNKKAIAKAINKLIEECADGYIHDKENEINSIVGDLECLLDTRIFESDC